MDKSLDEIISTRPKAIRRTAVRKTARQQLLGSAGTPPAARARIVPHAAAANGTKPVSIATQPADKIIVSNLPQDVNEVQIKELFQTTVGPLREVTLHYDSAGRSKGVASVHFSRKGDGSKAYQQYNNRLIDGKRPMKIEVVVDPSKLPPAPSLASRVAPPPAAAAAPVAASAPARRGVVGRGGARGGARRGGRRNERPPKSVADLDAEMEDYTASNGTTAPAVTAA
ncbi:hypothetical protein HETIRDRAFT_411258 [Heterobasidion irregulare TC 32-1]|uniref:RRM domain-containing protein n=1 Tax=Heterobasidion irregulare (strain TC 32-1) TaxID=747525 RepID=W4JXA2_HETIT|nr:uncharacterized protein HETIRDRAFT_411258 [Heterobasidion irregulare TC 32-1]ETW78089.1 hypothetical protein HETIRDRAFT_411258 [Heterobasidion irregulare TC 32-1]